MKPSLMPPTQAYHNFGKLRHEDPQACNATTGLPTPNGPGEQVKGGGLGHPFAWFLSLSSDLGLGYLAAEVQLPLHGINYSSRKCKLSIVKLSTASCGMQMAKSTKLYQSNARQTPELQRTPMQVA